jgi:hypothetical protein
MKLLAVSLLAIAAVAALPPAQGTQTFTGTITDSMCADANHAGMRMGPTDAECTIACVGEHDADYVLYDGRTSYVLSDRRMPEKLAGQRVRVTGTLDATTRTIRVESITAVK